VVCISKLQSKLMNETISLNAYPKSWTWSIDIFHYKNEERKYWTYAPL